MGNISTHGWLMDLSLVPTKDLIEAIASRLDTLLVLGLVVEKETGITYHRHLCGANAWALSMPLAAEIRNLNSSFDNAWDEPDNTPNSVIEF